MHTESLSFAVIEPRIQVMPDSPSAVLTTPRWLVPLNVFGAAGLIIGSLPCDPSPT